MWLSEKAVIYKEGAGSASEKMVTEHEIAELRSSCVRHGSLGTKKKKIH